MDLSVQLSICLSPSMGTVSLLWNPCTVSLRVLRPLSIEGVETTALNRLSFLVVQTGSRRKSSLEQAIKTCGCVCTTNTTKIAGFASSESPTSYNLH